MPRKVFQAIWDFTDTGWFWLMSGLWGLAYVVWLVVHLALALYHWIV